MKRVLVFVVFLFPMILNAQVIKDLHWPGWNLIGVGGCVVDDQSFIIRAENEVYKTVFCKMNYNGDTLWTRIFDGGLVGNSFGYAVNKQMAKTYDNGIVFIHQPHFQPFFNITKMDSSGNSVWTFEFVKGGDLLILSRVLETSDSGIVVLYKYGITHTWYNILVKLNKDGQILSTLQFYNGSAWDPYSCSDIVENMDHTFFISGANTIDKLDSSFQFVKGMDFNMTSKFDQILGVINDTIILKTIPNSSIIKIDTGGNVIHEISFNGLNPSTLPDVKIVNSVNEICFAGIDGNSNIILARLNSQFDTIKTDMFLNGLAVNIINPNSHTVLIANKYDSITTRMYLSIIISDTANNYCISSPGHFSCQKSTLTTSAAGSRMNMPSNNFFQADSPLTFTQGLTLNDFCSLAGVENFYNPGKINLYPNPAVNQLNISGIKQKEQVIIYNINGAKVLMKLLDKDDEMLDISEFSPGVYCVVIGGKVFRKLVKLGE